MDRLIPLLLIAIAGAPAIAAEGATPGRSQLVERGEYLVTRLGMCADCHSPRDQRGAFVQAEWLHGATLGFAPTVPMPVWAAYAPRLAGLPALPADRLRVLLTTGKRPDGSQPRPPMPEYRLNGEDADAVIAYLRGLP